MNNSVFITPKNNLCNVNLSSVEDVTNNCCVNLSTFTPVNHKRCFIRINDTAENETSDIPNLNMLFDSNIIYNSPKLYYNNDCYSNNSEKHANHTVNQCRRNTEASAYKMSYQDELNNKTDNCNFRTPKSSQSYFYSVRENSFKYNEEYFSMSIKSNSPQCCKIGNSPCSNCSFKLKNESNKKSKNHELNQNNFSNRKKECSNRNSTELSYFSPGLLNSKQCSTPINRLQNCSKLQLSENDEFLNKFEKTMVNNLAGNNILTPHTPKMCDNMFEKTPPSVAIERAKSNNCNHCLMRDQKLIVTKRKCYKISPKKLRLSPKKLNTSFKYEIDLEVQPFDYFAGVNHIIGKVKKYKNIMKWPKKLYNICSNLGDSVKTSIHTAINKVNCVSTQQNSSETKFNTNYCKCEEYKEEINILHLQVNELMGELILLKNHIDEKANQNTEKVDQVSKDIHILRQELKDIKDKSSKDIENVRLDIDFFKDNFNNLKQSTINQTSTVVPKAPSLPPPLPPPLPPTNFSLTNAKIKIEKKEKSATGNNSSSRPIISLEDILKVKLKKATNRSLSATNHRGSTPNVDILNQVKLKPASRSLRNASIDSGDITTPNNLTTSPHSSLCRLLTDNGSSSWKLKRLRKVSGYSLDSIHKRNLMGKRERDLTDE